MRPRVCRNTSGSPSFLYPPLASSLDCGPSSSPQSGLNRPLPSIWKIYLEMNYLVEVSPHVAEEAGQLEDGHYRDTLVEPRGGSREGQGNGDDDRPLPIRDPQLLN